MYGTCRINGTCGSKKVERLKLSCEGGNPQRGKPSFLGGVDPSRHHVLKKKIYHFLDILLHSIEACSKV